MPNTDNEPEDDFDDEDIDDTEDTDDGDDTDDEEEDDDGNSEDTDDENQGIFDQLDSLGSKAIGSRGKGRSRSAKGRSRGGSKASGKNKAEKVSPANSIGIGAKGLEFNIGGMSSGKIAMIAAGLSTILGGLWGGFQVYQQFLTMQKVTAAYVPPDMSGINSRLSVLDERVTSVERLTKGNSEALNYLTGSINSSVGATRQTVDAVSTSVRSSDAQNMQMQRAMIDQLRQQDQDQQKRIKDLENQMNDRIQKTLANPLAGKD